MSLYSSRKDFYLAFCYSCSSLTVNTIQSLLALLELTLESAAVFVLIQYLSHSQLLLSVFTLFPSVLIFVFVICLSFPKDSSYQVSSLCICK